MSWFCVVCMIFEYDIYRIPNPEAAGSSPAGDTIKYKSESNEKNNFVYLFMFVSFVSDVSIEKKKSQKRKYHL